MSKTGIIAVVGLMAAVVCGAQDAPPLAVDPKPVPELSGYLAFVPTWDSSNLTLVSIISPVVLVPLGRDFVFESRAAFEGDFHQRNGNSGDFTGAGQNGRVVCPPLYTPLPYRHHPTSG